MESRARKPFLIVVVGQTASGKSALALDIAERWSGEIIAADSRTIYKGMDIGTAKPSPADQRRVRHHLLDVTTPDRPYTVSDYKRLAEAAIADIAARGKLPILVGGTGLYIDAVLYDFNFRGVSNPEQRNKLADLSVSALQTILRERDIPLPSNEKNQRHLIRAIETNGQLEHQRDLRPNTLLVGLALGHNDLLERVTARVDAMFANGLVDEAKELAAKYGWESVPLQTIGYQELASYIAGIATFEEVRQLIIRHTMQYAKRQKTWFSRNRSIHWISKSEEYVDLVTTLLNK